MEIDYMGNLPDRSKFLPVLQPVGDELLVYSPLKGATYTLNETSAFVFQMCDGNTSYAEAERKMFEHFAVENPTELLMLTLHELSLEGLIPGDDVVKPSEPTLIDRRMVLTSLAATAIALPLISSILLPSPAAAASTCPTCANCTECAGVCNGTQPNCGDLGAPGVFENRCNYEMRALCAHVACGDGTPANDEFTGGVYLCRITPVPRNNYNCATARANAIAIAGGCPAANNVLYYCCSCPGNTAALGPSCP